MTTQIEHAPAAADDSLEESIRIRGARVHNLKNVDLDIPRDQLVVMTGPSGSGKSSLAFDTLYAEGQRQYIESLSPHARQFITQMQRPDVDSIDGLQPTICIDQRPAATNPRSTVATVTEIYDYLRVLMARLGDVRCYACQTPIRQQTPEQIQDRLMNLGEDTKLMLLAPMIRGRRGQHQEVFAKIRKAGFVRARVDGAICEVEQPPELDPRKTHTIEAIVDRIIVRAGSRGRLGESIQLALRHSEGLLVACYLDASTTTPEHPQGIWRDEIFNTLYACPNCGISYEEIEPRTFSFNSPYGACPTCDGLGVRTEFDPELVIPDRSLSIRDQAIAPLRSATPAVQKKLLAELESLLAKWQIASDPTAAEPTATALPLSEWSDAALEKLLRGDGKKWDGLLVWLEKQFATSTRKAWLTQLETFRGSVTCNACGGSRLRPEANNVELDGRTIIQVTRQSVHAAWDFFRALRFDGEDQPIAKPLLSEIINRLDFLRKVGVGYLSLARPADTLSGGELQRVRLASSIGSGLVGVCYVLDEPSIGLHPRDNDRLIQALRDLHHQGNTVLVVEHDEAMMREADYLIDVGPAAGVGGGRIVATGTPNEVAGNDDSITGRYLRGDLRIETPTERRRAAKSRSLTLEGAAMNNLKAIDVRFPLGVFVCVTGVSGSGKSSLVNETLTRAVARRLGQSASKPGPHTSLRGASQIDKLIEIDQSPIGRSPRSNPATYTGAFDEIRRVFATTRDAKQRGYGASRFSFNVKGGRCEHCQGQGMQKIEMNFLPDLYVTCPECQGTRFDEATRQVRYRGLNISDVLDLSIDRAAEFFENFPKIHRMLESLREVGLGYLMLGQASTTLSGGEAQRIKLATELARVDTGKTLYVLDEPTTGLHFDDIRRLLEVLGKLVDRGNTVIVIEHHLDVIKSADWLIDLGPEGGEAGGQLVAEGTPEEIAAVAESHTGRFLRDMLSFNPQP
ncbi:MAG: excinuclease ABC subunit UvrA [Planctomycetales bacterium]|nr:excinuclease ABC subunit UvrA [Planctomycetales bacterium]